MTERTEVLGRLICTELGLYPYEGRLERIAKHVEPIVLEIVHLKAAAEELARLQAAGDIDR